MSRKADQLRRQHGQQSERLACAYLRRLGYHILATNVRVPVGELDLVAQEAHTLCLVEVRSHHSEAFGHPLESVDHRKRHRLVRAAQWYLQRCRVVPSAIRFDVVAITYPQAGKPVVELVRGAFTADGFSTF